MDLLVQIVWHISKAQGLVRFSSEGTLPGFALGFLKYTKHFLQEDKLRSMYLSIVERQLSCHCSVWGCCDDTKVNTLQTLQNRAARVVTGSPFDLLAAPLLQRLGWLSLIGLSIGKHLPWYINP